MNVAYIFGVMWMPRVASILTCRIVGRPLSRLGLGRWNGRFVLIGYPVPIACCLVASLGIWILGFGGFPNTDFVRQTAESFGVGGAPDWVVIAMFVGLTGTTGMLSGVAAAAGEGIGWRGFLVPELVRVLPFTGVALVSGLNWASWHYPITAVVYRDGGLPSWFLVVDVHLCGGRHQLRAGISTGEVRKRVAADLPAREP